jgi:hypothetical protein
VGEKNHIFSFFTMVTRVQVSEELLESGQVSLSMAQKESTLEQLKQDMWLGGDENEIYIGVSHPLALLKPLHACMHA